MILIFIAHNGHPGLKVKFFNYVKYYSNFQIDYEALDKQIQEKKKREGEERLLEEKYSEYLRRNSLIAQAYERKEQEVPDYFPKNCFIIHNVFAGKKKT